MTPSAGTYLLDASGRAGTSYPRDSRLLPVFAANAQRRTYGPVFWWRDQAAVFDNGDIHALCRSCPAGESCNNRGWVPGPVLASGLPRQVVSVSSDLSGEHLLVTVVTPAQPELFRYDRGLLTRVPGWSSEAAW